MQTWDGLRLRLLALGYHLCSFFPLEPSAAGLWRTKDEHATITQMDEGRERARNRGGHSGGASPENDGRPV